MSDCRLARDYLHLQRQRHGSNGGDGRGAGRPDPRSADVTRPALPRQQTGRGRARSRPPHQPRRRTHRPPRCVRRCCPVDLDALLHPRCRRSARRDPPHPQAGRQPPLRRARHLTRSEGGPPTAPHRADQQGPLRRLPPHPRHPCDPRPRRIRDRHHHHLPTSQGAQALRMDLRGPGQHGLTQPNETRRRNAASGNCTGTTPTSADQRRGAAVRDRWTAAPAALAASAARCHTDGA